MIPVTKPFIPPAEEYKKYIDGIWDRIFLTNNGPLVQDLEYLLKEYLGVKNLLYLSNGTIALQIAIKALDLRGEVITTPFSFVATTASLVWENCKPVFIDIEEGSFNIDPTKIEEAITEHTTGILATHVFGNPCDIEAIEAIAEKNNLKVIYDAAHCFGALYKGRSVFEYGDVSTTSFHATKLFHTVEGGAVFANDDEIHSKVSRMRNFGHNGPEKFSGVGINGKNSELHAAMGLCNLKYIEEILTKRKEQSDIYDELLEFNRLRKPIINTDSSWNYSYYPVTFRSEEILLKVKSELEKNEISPRRYFYPSLDELEYVQSASTRISHTISKTVLCLPVFYDLKKEDQILISNIINSNS